MTINISHGICDKSLNLKWKGQVVLYAQYCNHNCIIDKFTRNKAKLPVISHTIQYFNICVNGRVVMKTSRCSKGQCTMYFSMSDMVST